MNIKIPAIVSLSGGMDSVTALAWAQEHHSEVHAVSFRYKSKHNQYELANAIATAKERNVDSHRIVDVDFDAMKSDLLLSGGDIPEGHYEHETMTATVVPGRNTIFASILMGIAESLPHDKRGRSANVILGIHSGDHAIYPDCRPEWLEAMNALAFAATSVSIPMIDKNTGKKKNTDVARVRFVAPFLNLDKRGILDIGYACRTPVDYSKTRTCYKAQGQACGRCGSCQERLEAFASKGIEDPIAYDTREILPKVVKSPQTSDDEPGSNVSQ